MYLGLTGHFCFKIKTDAKDMIINCNKIKSSWYQLLFGSKLTTENSKKVLPSNQYSQASANSYVKYVIRLRLRCHLQGIKKWIKTNPKLNNLSKLLLLRISFEFLVLIWIALMFFFSLNQRSMLITLRSWKMRG